MRQLVSKVLTVSGIAIIGVVLVTTVIAYYVRTCDDGSSIQYDGLGRVLTSTPFIVRLVVGMDSSWAGWLWFVADFIIFWGTMATGIRLVRAGTIFVIDDQRESEDSTE